MKRFFSALIGSLLLLVSLAPSQTHVRSAAELNAAFTNSRPGDTVWVHGGRYLVDKDYGIVPRTNGTASLPIIYRAVPGEHVELYSDRTPPWAVLDITTSYNWFWGFDVYHTDVSTPDEAPLVAISGNYNKLINCDFHDAKSVGTNDFAGIGTEVVGCSFYYNGRQTRISQFGYGGYIQNKAPSPRKTYRQNSIFSNWDAGQQFYGSDATAMDNISIDSNRFFNNGNLQPKVSEQFQPNIIIGAGEATAKVVTGITFRGNMGFYSASPANGHYFQMGYHGSGISGWIVTNNIMVSQANSGFSFPEGYGGSTIQNNVIVGPSQSVVSAGTGNVGYANLAAASSRPTDIRVDRNPYESKRANITIFNWSGAPVVNVNLSSILAVGDRYEIRSVTNFWGNVLASGTYSGGTVPITMANITMKTPYGSPAFPPRNPAPYFAALVLVGPQSGTVPPPPPPPPPPAPTGSLTVSPLSLPYGGGMVTLTWTALNATSATIDAVAVSATGGSRLASVTATQTFTLRLVGAGGATNYSASVVVSTTPPPPPPPPPPVVSAYDTVSVMGQVFLVRKACMDTTIYPAVRIRKGAQ